MINSILVEWLLKKGFNEVDELSSRLNIRVPGYRMWLYIDDSVQRMMSYDRPMYKLVSSNLYYNNGTIFLYTFNAADPNSFQDLEVALSKMTEFINNVNNN